MTILLSATHALSTSCLHKLLYDQLAEEAYDLAFICSQIVKAVSSQNGVEKNPSQVTSVLSKSIYTSLLILRVQKYVVPRSRKCFT